MAETTLPAKTFQFELVSPEAVLASEEVRMVVVPGEAGEFGVLAGHVPMLSSIRPGVVSVTGAGGETRRIFVSGGFADVSGDSCSVLAEEAVQLGELDKDYLTQELHNLQDDLGFAKDDEAKLAQIERDMAIVRAKLYALEKHAA